MKRIILRIIICQFLSISILCQAQTNSKHIIYSNLEDALRVHKDSVYALDLRMKNLSSIPKVIFEFKNLVYVDLSMNKISSVQCELFQLPNIEDVLLNFNPITQLPSCSGTRSSVKSISLIKTDVKKLPMDLTFYNNLEELNLSFCNIKKLPESISSLTKLRLLILDYEVDSDKSLFSVQEKESLRKKLNNCKIIW